MNQHAYFHNEFGILQDWSPISVLCCILQNWKVGKFRRRLDVWVLEVKYMYGVRATLVVCVLYVTSPQYTNSYPSHSSSFCTHLDIEAPSNIAESH